MQHGAVLRLCAKQAEQRPGRRTAGQKVAALVVLLRGDVKVAVAADYGFVAEDRVAVVDLRPDACAACDSDRAQFRVCVVARVLISGAKQRRLCAFDMDRRKAGQTARDQCVVGG